MLLITGQAMPNVQGALVQLGSQSRSTFFHFHAYFPIDVVLLHRADRLDDEPYLTGLQGGSPHLCRLMPMLVGSE
jgi:hypothetical protein